MLQVRNKLETKIEQKVSRRRPDRTTIGLRSTTKQKLDKNRAPGQCYSGFLCEFVDLWGKTMKEDRTTQ